MRALRLERAAGDAPRLFLLSFLILFVELMLIRWTTAKVIYLSYFTNFVLLGSFLGIGLGFIKRYQRLFRFAPLVLGALVAFVYFYPTRLAHSAGGRLIYFGVHTGGTPIWLALPAIFAAVTIVLMMVAEEAAHVFGRLAPLRAYRFDLIGSIVGAGFFSLLSWLQAPPLSWGCVVGLVFLLLYGWTVRILQIAGIALLLVPLGLEVAHGRTTWSPYYAVKVNKQGPQTYQILVNGIPHQRTEPLAAVGDYYRQPYRHLRGNPPGDVLVVGAGNGLDVAMALSRGAKHVDAVEIDPQLLHIGRRLNPSRPYQDPRVTTHVTDGRQFLEQSHTRYDLILFALPDSLTLVANQSSLRLESYLFTLQAFQSARAHLKPRGVFAMYNFYRQQWLVDRFARSLTQAYGHRPCLDEKVNNGAVLGPVADLTIGRSAGAVRCRHLWFARTSPPAPATDDHPFPYLKAPGVPSFYLLTLALILGVSFAAVRTVGGRIGAMRGYLDLFFMGCAFLLLETKGVVQFALLFGTTWLVNSLVFIGVLLAVLAAVEVTSRVRIGRLAPLYALLMAALLVTWAVPPHLLLLIGFWPRLLAAFALYFAPIFVANVIFARRFKDVAAPTTAFGANLLGAMVGGLLEYGSLLVGYRALLLVVAALYGCALVAGRRHLRLELSPA